MEVIGWVLVALVLMIVIVATAYAMGIWQALVVWLIAAVLTFVLILGAYMATGRL